MLVSGMSVFIRFKDSEVEGRFKNWLVRGNAKSETLGVGSLGLRADLLRVSETEYLFCYEHDFFVNMSLFLRLALFFQLRRFWGRFKIRRARKPEVVHLLMNRGGVLFGK